MSKRALILLYSSALFMLVYGIELLYGSFATDEQTPFQLFNEFQITQLIYVFITILAVRLICKRYYPSANRLMLAVGLAFMFPLFICTRYGLEELIWPAIFHRSNYNDNITFQFYIADNIGYALYYTIVGIMLFAIDYTVAQQKRLFQLETAQKEAELQALNAQFNPHFLFNSLNNIYALIQTNQQAASEAVIHLSAVTRYLTEQKEALIRLEQERNQCDHYIKLQALRYAKAVHIKSDIDEHLEDALIPPYILLGSIENACKHGNLFSPEQPLTISIHKVQKELHINIINAIGNQQKDSGSGIGLKNLEKRLSLLYPDKHQLKVSDTNNLFSIEIIIPYATALLHS